MRRGSSALTRVLESPIVKSANYGDGSRQFEEQIRRYEFWSLTGAKGAINPGYSVRLSATVLRGTQTYGIAGYDVSQGFPGTSDVSVLAHELAEWYDDPFVNNATPKWGHIGQVPGCQANLEVGDPLSGRLHSVRSLRAAGPLAGFSIPFRARLR